jgi:hypothetical protein
MFVLEHGLKSASCHDDCCYHQRLLDQPAIELRSKKKKEIVFVSMMMIATSPSPRRWHGNTCDVLSNVSTGCRAPTEAAPETHPATKSTDASESGMVFRRSQSLVLLG